MNRSNQAAAPQRPVEERAVSAIELQQTTWEGIEKMLREGAALHGFSSGGGLRVIGVSVDDKEIAYGEAPNIEEALGHAAEDFRQGYTVRDVGYKEVYGKIHMHYLTGSTEITSDLDGWVRGGNRIDAAFSDGKFVFSLDGYEHHKAPEGYEEKALAGEVLVWSSRGYTYEVKSSRFPNGKPCVSTRIVSKPEGRSGADPWMWPITKTGTGATLREAIDAAFAADPVESKGHEARLGALEKS